MFYSLFMNWCLMQQVKDLSMQEQYYESQEIIQYINKDSDIDIAAYHYFKTLNAFKLLDKETVLKESEFFEDSLIPIPQRYIVLVELMKDEVEKLKDNKTNDIYRKMDLVSSRLKNSQAGPKTRQLQKEILDDLDKLIKSVEDAKKEKENKDKDNQDKKDKQRQKENEDSNGNNISSPKQDSDLPIENALGETDLKKIKQLSLEWGKLPEKSRAAAMQQITRNMPSKYREAIESYFRELDKTKKRR